MAEKYRPTLKEVQKAEDTMTDEQKQMSEARSEGFGLGSQEAKETRAKTDKLEEEKKRQWNEVRAERFGRISDFVSEVLPPKEFFAKYPNAKVVWFGNFGETKSQMESPKGKSDLHYVQFDHAFIFNQKTADDCLREISANIRHDGWDKYYICADESLARYIQSNISVAEKLRPKE